MGQNIEIRGCPGCGGIMTKVTVTDKDGNTVSETPFMCVTCGPMA